MYIQVRTRFTIALFFAIFWFSLSAYLSRFWVIELATEVGLIGAAVIISFIALIPGFMNMFLLSAYILDARQNIKIKLLDSYPPVSIFIPAYNESANIADTLHSLLTQEYQGEIEIIVIDDGSKDNTREIIQSIQAKNNNIILLFGHHEGKPTALNMALAVAKHDLVITLDADTYLLPDAIFQLIVHFKAVPRNVAASAGCVFVRNHDYNAMTQLQNWEYFFSIAAIKRVQSLLQGTLVAQGAFSIYKKEVLIEIGGWPNVVGEDIVLTWQMLDRHYIVTHAERAISFTTVPTTYRQFFHQRSRWSRGMLEAFRSIPSILFKRRLSTFIIFWDLLFPVIDFTYVLVFLPGVILALFGYYYIAGPMTLAVLPIALAQNFVFYRKQNKTFKSENIDFKGSFFYFVIYVLFYNILMVFPCINGYISEMFNTKKSWGTK